MKEKLEQFKSLLLDENTRQNLTRITDPREIDIKHFDDSLALLPYLPARGQVIDVGAGAGFPSVPLAIARGELSITALDSLQKRVRFLLRVQQELGLQNLLPIHGRAEELARKAGFRGAFDAAVSRAVARLDKLAGWCLPFVKAGGVMIAMKGARAEEEVREARGAIAKAGGEVEGIVRYSLEGCEEHALVIIHKNIL